MRLLIAFTAALLLAPAIVTADSQEEPRDALAVTVLRVVGKGVYVSWTPAPGAVMYDVYRGPTLESLTHLTQTPALEYADLDAPNEDMWYQIVSRAPSTNLGDDVGPMRGRCIAMRSAGIAVTVANCMPTSGPFRPL